MDIQLLSIDLSRSLSFHIPSDPSYPIVSKYIQRSSLISLQISNSLSFHIQILILSYPNTYPMISLYSSICPHLLLLINLLSYTLISRYISLVIQLLIPSSSLISSDVSDDILPFIPVELFPGSSWSGLPLRAAAALLYASNCVFISAPPDAGLSRPRGPSAGLVGAR